MMHKTLLKDLVNECKKDPPFGLQDERPSTPPQSSGLIWSDEDGAIHLPESPEEDKKIPHRPVVSVSGGQDVKRPRVDDTLDRNKVAMATNRLLHADNINSAEMMESRALFQEQFPKDVHVESPDGKKVHIKKLQTATTARRRAEKRSAQEQKANEDLHRARQVLKQSSKPYHTPSMASSITTTTSQKPVNGMSRKIYRNGLNEFFTDQNYSQPYDPSPVPSVISAETSTTSSSNEFLCRAKTIPKVHDLLTECLSLLVKNSGDTSKARRLYHFLSGNVADNRDDRQMFDVVVSVCENCETRGYTISDTMKALIRIMG